MDEQDFEKAIKAIYGSTDYDACALDICRTGHHHFSAHWSRRFGSGAGVGSRDAAKVLSNVVVGLLLPGNLYSLSQYFTRQQLIEAWLPLCRFHCGAAVLLLEGRIFSVIFKIPWHRQGVFAVLFSFSIQFSLVFRSLRLFSATRVCLFAVFYYLANTVVF